MGQQPLAMDTASRSQQFHELLKRHRKIVFKVAHSYSRHPDDRADLAQEIAAQLWRAFPAYDGRRPFSTWMYRIALNVAISFLRNHRHREQHSVPLDEEHHDTIGATGVQPESDERVRLLHRFIAQLDGLNRALLLLYLDEKTYREIAEILGITETNVATKIGRLKQRIRNDMADT
ncbi:MAG: sigma-70 family RNA polymerase sigma factor [Rudaea sp.]|nr:sigma-70 family RNA polymerase sigma factor [Rudaea sp.]